MVKKMFPPPPLLGLKGIYHYWKYVFFPGDLSWRKWNHWDPQRPLLAKFGLAFHCHAGSKHDRSAEESGSSWSRLGIHSIIPSKWHADADTSRAIVCTSIYNICTFTYAFRHIYMYKHICMHVFAYEYTPAFACMQRGAPEGGGAIVFALPRFTSPRRRSSRVDVDQCEVPSVPLGCFALRRRVPSKPWEYNPTAQRRPMRAQKVHTSHRISHAQ